MINQHSFVGIASSSRRYLEQYTTHADNGSPAGEAQAQQHPSQPITSPQDNESVAPWEGLSRAYTTCRDVTLSATTAPRVGVDLPDRKPPDVAERRRLPARSRL
jgi:hypothetical protein